ncbi:flavin-containing monooxygenase [Microbacterium suwonense]
MFSPQPEIYEYLRRTAKDEGLLPHVVFHAEILDARWDGELERWVVTTTAGTWRARVFVAATGHLADPKAPQITGIDQFAGDLFHSAAWDHEATLHGKRIGVIGTGASGIQVIPQMAAIAKSVTVFQRSAPYIIPREERAYADHEREAFRKFPGLMEEVRRDLFWTNEGNYAARRMVPQAIEKARAQSLDFLAAEIQDEELRAKLTPDYDPGCKRILISNTYYATMRRENVELVVDRIERVTERGVVTADGTEHPLEALILCTGFEAADLPISHRVRGVDGELLADRWSGGMSAYRAMTVSGFPNFFLINGPNTGLGHNSAIYIIESQIDYIVGGIEYLLADDTVLEVPQEIEDAYMDELDRRSQGTVWVSGGCSSWYLDARSGRLTVVWPEFAHAFRAENASFDPSPFRSRVHLST